MRKRILEAALKAAKKHGYNRVTRHQIAAAGGGITPSNVQYHLGKSAEVREAILLEAIEKKYFPVLAQAAGMRDIEFLDNAPNPLIDETISWLKGALGHV